MSDGRILVVDDGQVNRMVLTKALTADGHVAVTAENGLEALELLRAENEPPVDIVLLDLEMPELDGYETLKRIKADERLRHLPVMQPDRLLLLRKTAIGKHLSIVRVSKNWVLTSK